MPQPIPEIHKQPGVHYAYAPNGLELPVIDVTHPAFRVDLSETELFARAERYARREAAKGPVARLAQSLLLPFFLRRSRIGRGLLHSMNGYLDGMTTYLMKLGAGNLGAGYANDMDRRIAQGLADSGLLVSLRLQDLAEILAEALAAPLAAAPGRPLHFVNIAGGPGMDSLNALILLRQREAALLNGRSIVIHLLDLETEGAQFGAAALTSLQAEGGPLQGLDIAWKHQAYDWTETKGLEELLRGLGDGALVAASSEGGLFDYGQDRAVRANLKVLHDFGPNDAVLGATISRPDGPGQAARQGTAAKLVLRTLEEMETLAAGPGWKVTATRRRPMNFVLGLEKI
jgi:hypothetical protein